MPYAFVVNVEFEPGGDPAEAQRMLAEDIVPRIKAQPGFQSGTWLRAVDQKTGMGAVIFDTEANASAALSTIPAERPPNAPKITNSAVYEVVFQA